MTVSEQRTSEPSAPLTYEQEVHALLYAAAANTESLLRYFESQLASEVGDAKKLTQKCIDWKRDDLRRIRELIPKAESRRDEKIERAEPSRGAPQHTPGPWKTVTGAMPRDGKNLAIGADGVIIARVEHSISDLDRARVLLEALKHMKANFYDDFGDQCTECGEKVGTEASCDSCRVYAEAEAAIKQAERGQ